MMEHWENAVARASKASNIKIKSVIQELRGGYGKIYRCKTSNPDLPRIIVKHIQYPVETNRRESCKTDLSHKRKLRSYQVEIEWYRKWSSQCDNSCRVPGCIAIEASRNEILIVLEDLDLAGYSQRIRSAGYSDLVNCLAWLANFHATFLGKEPVGLWKTGTYWHLATRPDELNALTDYRLKQAAPGLDRALNECRYKTFVHGDAKLANFCFSSDCSEVAAVDFQYVGGGCGMKDVVYLVGCCLSEKDCERMESQILEDYFRKLKEALLIRKSNINFALLENEWRKMYRIAWADFHRFLKGWSPGNWKPETYSEKITGKVMDELGI
ncbi:MAG: oxidoreductase family protein [Candidatus Riflebacteria bacterium]